MSERPLWVRVGIVLWALATLAASWGCVRGKDALPQARHGEIDLAAYDFHRSGPVALDGEWAFYWDRLLTPGDFEAGGPVPEKTGYLVFPGSWAGVAHDGHPLPGTGQATFLLRILPGPRERHLTLRLFDIQAAYRLWINGTFVAHSGVVGRSPDAEQENPSSILASVRTDGQPLQLILQISNYHFHRGGVPVSILLGEPGALELAHMRAWGSGLFFAGSLLIMGLYHLVLYVWRKTDTSPLYFGLYCLLWMGNFITSDVTEWVVHLFVASSHTSSLDKLSLLFYIISVPVGYRFFRKLYPLEFSFYVQLACDVSAIVFGSIAIFCSSLFVYASISYCYATSIIFITYCFYKLYRCLRHGRDGALFIFCGFVVLGMVAINDMLYHLGIIESIYLIQVGMFVFVLFQALALAQRFSHAFTAVEGLSVALRHNNVALQEEIVERNRLEREIVNISEEERRRISHELHDGLCQQLTGARLRCSVLGQKFTNAATPADWTLLTDLLDASVNDAYDLSRGLWPVEHDPSVPGPSLEDLVRRMAASSGIAIALHQKRRCAKCVNPNATPLYRIAQEALANAVKHARAGSITVTLCCTAADHLELTVVDDGVGREPDGHPRGGLGIGIMAHRAKMIGATLEIADAPGGGTLVRCIASCDGLSKTTPGNGETEASHDGR